MAAPWPTGPPAGPVAALVFGTSMAAPAETMPGWLQAWAEVNPVSHAIDASRGLLLGGPVAEPVAMALLWGGIALVVLAPLRVGLPAAHVSHHLSQLVSSLGSSAGVVAIAAAPAASSSPGAA